ncbi:MAG: hypothetical protein V1905_01980 [bacterium]
MKKIFAILTILTVAVSVLPMVASAATNIEGPGECCKMRRGVTIDGVTVAKDAVVGDIGSIAAAPTSCYISGAATTPTNEKGNWGLYCTMNTINTLVDYIFIFIVTVVMIFVMLGAFSILTAAGDPEKITTGRNYIIYAAVGMAIAFLARAVPALVKAILGV